MCWRLLLAATSAVARTATPHKKEKQPRRMQNTAHDSTAKTFFKQQLLALSLLIHLQSDALPLFAPRARKVCELQPTKLRVLCCISTACGSLASVISCPFNFNVNFSPTFNCRLQSLLHLRMRVVPHNYMFCMRQACVMRRAKVALLSGKSNTVFRWLTLIYCFCLC